MSLEEFDQAFNFFYLETGNSDNNLRDIRRQVLRWLDALGYCEFDFNKRRVYTCEPVFALLPSTGCKRYIVTGARNEKLISSLSSYIKKFKSSANLLKVNQLRDKVIFPDAIIIETVDDNIIYQCASELNINVLNKDLPASWLILNIMANIEEYERTFFLLPVSPIKNWSARTFSVNNLHFIRGEIESMNPRLVEYTNPINQQKLHRYIKANEYSDVDRELGRYLCLKYNKKRILLYDSRKQLLAVPSSVPLPRLLFKSIILCSGVIPKKFICSNQIKDIPGNTAMEVFVGIPKFIAERVSVKISMELIEHNFIFSEEGELL